MKVLLLGEYSNAHYGLAHGLRNLGHEVLLVSCDGHWRGYRNDIRLVRKSNNKLDSIKYLVDILYHLKDFRGFDVVQIINPCFFDLKAERNWLIYQYLRKYNKTVFLGAFGTDHYWVKACVENKTYRYSDFWVNGKPRIEQYTQKEITEWMDTTKEEVNRKIAEDCDGIIGCLYEYWAAYHPLFPHKTTYIPLPIEEECLVEKSIEGPIEKVKFFLGIQKERSIVKGTDVVAPILDKLAAKYPDDCEVTKTFSVPYTTYQKLIESSHVLIDQIYSYTPAMNALLGMSKGLVSVSGAEPEHYQLIKEDTLHPIVNVLPDEEHIYQELEKLILEKDQIPQRSADSMAYIRKHHLATQVAKQYLEFWQSKGA